MKNGRKNLSIGLVILLSFVIWTVLIQTVDVKPEGIFGTNVGFATVNTWFHTSIVISLGFIADTRIEFEKRW